MTRRDFEIFVSVAKHGSIKATAQELFISQSSVSQAILEIERKYNVCLFERFSKQFFLTEAGHTFLDYASSILRLEEELEDYLNNKPAAPTLSIGATVTIGSCLISPIVSELKRRYPHALVNVHVTNTKLIEEMLLQNRIDISLVEGHISNPSLISEHAISDQLMLICPPTHPLSKRAAISAAELSQYPLILREDGSGTRSQLEEQLHQHGIKYHIAWSCTTSDAIIQAVMANHGVSVISRRLIENYVRDGLLCACDIHDIATKRWFSIVHHKKKNPTELFNAFISICKSLSEQAKGAGQP